MEQISHHPPISAFQLVGPGMGHDTVLFNTMDIRFYDLALQTAKSHRRRKACRSALDKSCAISLKTVLGRGAPCLRVKSCARTQTWVCSTRLAHTKHKPGRLPATIAVVAASTDLNLAAFCQPSHKHVQPILLRATATAILPYQDVKSL